MKARIVDPLSKKQRKRLEEEVQKEHQKQSLDKSRMDIKMFCVAAYLSEGLGKKRLMRIIDKLSEVCAEREHDEIFWTHIDRIVIEQIGLDFPREDYDALDL